MGKIKSESKLLWVLIKDVLLLPLTFLLVLLKKKKISDLFRPLKDFVGFIFEARITIALIILNIAVYVIVNILFLNGKINMGFIDQNLVDKPEYLLGLNFFPIIASWFMHGSVLHLVGNMLFLFVLGRIVERRLGAKTLIVYFGAAIVSAIVNDLMHINVAGYSAVGASGAIAGLGAAALLIDPLYVTYAIGVPLPVVLVVFLQIVADLNGVLYPVKDNIGHLAHLAGYFSIALTMFLLGKENREKMKKGFIIGLVVIGVSVLLYFLRI